MNYNKMSTKEFCENNARGLMQMAFYHYEKGNDKIANQFNADAVWWFDFAEQYEYKTPNRKYKRPYISTGTLMASLLD